MSDYDEFGAYSDPEGIEKAWIAVQEELESGWSVAGVSRGRGPTDWMATATGRKGAGVTGYGPSPRDALLDLLDAVRAQKSEALRKKLPRPW